MFLSTLVVAFGLMTTSLCAPATFSSTSKSPISTPSLQLNATSPITTATVFAVASFKNNMATVSQVPHVTATSIPTILPNSFNITTSPKVITPDIIIIQSPLGCPTHITNKWNQLGGAGGPLGAAVGGLVNTPTVHQVYTHGAIYCKGVLGPAFAVYGNIYLKFKAQGNYGYPTSDETGATDAMGQTIRFNTFSNGGAIYWSAQDGAHLIYGDIYKKWVSINGLQQRGYGMPVTDEDWGYPGDTSRFNNFKYGGAIYWTGANGAHLIYGDILLKWRSVGGPKWGHPITDEATAGDSFSRFNNFDNGGAIYWTPTNGAHLIYGDIYKEWMAIGGTTSVVGYPITDESSSGNHGGRFNDFSRGMIYWHPQHNVYVHVGGLPNSLTFNWNPINFNGVPVNGGASVILYNNGNVHWNSNMHCSVPLAYDYSIAFGIVTADQQPYTFGHKGTTGPNWGFLGGHPDDGYDYTLNSDEVRENWRAFVAMSDWSWQANTSLGLADLFDEIVNAFKAIYPLVTAAIAILA